MILPGFVPAGLIVIAAILIVALAIFLWPGEDE